MGVPVFLSVAIASLRSLPLCCSAFPPFILFPILFYGVVSWEVEIGCIEGNLGKQKAVAKGKAVWLSHVAVACMGYAYFPPLAPTSTPSLEYSGSLTCSVSDGEHFSREGEAREALFVPAMATTCKQYL